MIGDNRRRQRRGVLGRLARVRHVKVDMNARQTRLDHLRSDESIAIQRQQRGEPLIPTTSWRRARPSDRQPEGIGLNTRRARRIEERGDPADRHYPIVVTTGACGGSEPRSVS